MTGLSIWISVGVGGALGAVGRYGLTRAMTSSFGGGFPWGTFAVNILGSFLMGVMFSWLIERNVGSPELRAFMTTGILGAFTTFSTYSLDVVLLLKERAYLEAGGYLLGSVLLSIAGLVLGMSITKALV